MNNLNSDLGRISMDHIENLLKNGDYQKVIELLENKKEKNSKNYIALGISYYGFGKKNKAVANFKKALLLDSNNADAHYNLAEVYLQLEKYPKAKDHALKVIEKDPTDWQAHDILSTCYAFEGFYNKALYHLNEAIKHADDFAVGDLKEKLAHLKERMEKAKNQKKLAIICAKGLDNFIDDIVKGLSDEYWVQRWTVTNDKEIKAAIDWADIVWLEWANEVAIIGTNYPSAWTKPIVVRLHGYESLRNDFLNRINWSVVDDIVFVAYNVRNTAFSNKPDLSKVRNIVIPNGLDLKKYRFNSRKKGTKLAFAGHLNYKKNPMLMIQILKKLVDLDGNFTLHWAGDIQDDRIWRYLNHILNDMDISKNFVFDGWIEDMNEWLEDKNYFISTSIHEGYGVAIMEAMAKGIKPVIHNFYIATEFYPRDFLFNTVDEAVHMVISDEYDSSKYRAFVEKYSLENQLKKINSILNSIVHSKNHNYRVIDINKDHSKVKEIVSNYLSSIFGNIFGKIPNDKYEILALSIVQSEYKNLLEGYLNTGKVSNNIQDLLINFYRIYKGKNIHNESLEDFILKYSRFIAEKLEEFQEVTKEVVVVPRRVDDVTKYRKDETIKVMMDLRDMFFFNNNLKAVLDFFIIHGSLASNDYTEFSDVDTLVALRMDKITETELRKLSEIFRNALNNIVLKFDPLQHHGFFVITSIDMKYYPQIFMPIEVINKGIEISPSNNKKRFRVRSDKLELSIAIVRMFNYFKHIYESYQKGAKLYDPFNVKRYISRFFMLPILYYELFENEYAYKREILERVKKKTKFPGSYLFHIFSEMRDKWRRDTKQVIFLNNDIIENVYLYSKKLYDLLKMNITEIFGGI